MGDERSSHHSLKTYREKRNFDVTPEPAAGGVPNEEARTFVIQKHWASRLHYDFRLELDGTMKSWAVPKGPSFDPADKRMAVHVEDHPISYNSFEGTIPPGNYGAGKVIIWDKGVWIPLEDPHKGYRDGKLKFELRGHKMHGHWALVRMKARGDERQEPWLLIKEKDDYVRPASEFSVVDEMPDSVKALADRPAARKRLRHVRLPRPRRSHHPHRARPRARKKRRCPRSCSPSSRRWWTRRPRTTTTGSTRSSSTAIACSPAPRAAACASSPATATTGPANCRAGESA